jgi:hypothetical protein
MEKEPQKEIEIAGSFRERKPEDQEYYQEARKQVEDQQRNRKSAEEDQSGITINERGEIIGANRESVPQREQNEPRETIEENREQVEEEFIGQEAFLERMSSKEKVLEKRKEKIDYAREKKEEAEHQSYPKDLESYESSLEEAQTQEEKLGQETIKEYRNLDSRRNKLQEKLVEHLEKKNDPKTKKEKWEKKNQELTDELKEVVGKMSIAEKNEKFKEAQEKSGQVVDEESLNQARESRKGLGQEILDREQKLKDRKENLEQDLIDHQEKAGQAKSLKEIKQWCAVKEKIEKRIEETMNQLESESFIDLLNDSEKKRTIKWKEILGREMAEELRREFNERSREEGEESSESEESIEELEEAGEDSSEEELDVSLGEERLVGDRAAAVRSSERSATWLSKSSEFLKKIGFSGLLVIFAFIKKLAEKAFEWVYSAFGVKKEKKKEK